MTYFKNINNLEQAKLQHRKLAKQLHPDRGGSEIQFKQMEGEYRTLLLQLQTKQQASNRSYRNEIINELSSLATNLLDKQIPQDYLKNKIKSSRSPLQKVVLSGLVQVLNGLNS